MLKETLGAMLVAVMICTLGACAAPKHYVAMPVPGTVASPASDKCDSLLSKERTWKTIAAATAVAGGSGGLATIPTRDDTARDAIAVSAVSVGVLSAVSIYLSESYASEMRERRCIEVLTSDPPPL